jgi:hypothetical protein
MADTRNGAPARIDPLSPATRTRVVARALVVVRAAIAIATSAAITTALTRSLPRPLDAHTDVVGYPIHANFNVNRYLWVYALWVAFFPVLALAVDLVLSRLTRGRLPHPDWAQQPRAPEAVNAPPWSSPAVGIGRTAFVGVVLGLGAALLLDLDGASFFLVTLTALVLYAALAVAAATYATGLRVGLTRWERLAGANLCAAPLTVLSLYGLSEATEMRVLASGDIYEYRWFPFWLAALVAAAALAVVLTSASRAGSGARLRALERRALLLVAAPVLLFILVARLPGEIGVIDFFHEGELLAATHLTAKGAVPWRDLIFVHGILNDVVAPLVGFAAFENTRWGYFAGAAMIIAPVYFISQYFLFAYLFGRNVLFLLGTQVGVVLGLIRDVHFRFVLLPFALLLLAAVLRHPSWRRAAALATVLLVQAVLSPETTVAIPAFLGSLALFELFSYDRARPRLVNFHRTVRTVACGALGIAVLFAVFAALRILDDFVFYYRTFLSDHVLTGGIPLRWLDTRFEVAAVAPVVLVVLTIWFFAAAWRTRRTLAIDDWVMAGLALTILLYYPKFLVRPDAAHLYHVFPVAVPLLAYTAYRVLSLFERHRLRLGRSRLAAVPGLTAVALVVLALAAPAPVLDTAEAIPQRVSAQSHFGPVAPRLSFLSPWAIDVDVILDVNRVLNAYLEPEDHVFDFSNNPLLFHYLLERRPTSKYFHVSMAARKHTQSNLIEHLERRKPRLVVFSSSETFGLPLWDGVPNHVRHYDVSEYVLDHYRPLLVAHEFLFMARDDSGFTARSGLARELTEPPVTAQLYFRTHPCDWGYAPNFLRTAPDRRDTSRAVDVVARPTAGVVIASGWAADLEAKAPAAGVVAVGGGRVLAHAVPSGERAEVAGRLGGEGFTRSGFAMVIPGPVPLQEVRFFALTRDGRAQELVYGPKSGLAPTSSAPTRVVVDGRSYAVASGGVHGRVETVVPEKRTWALDLPRGSTPADYDWLEIEPASRFAHDGLGITDVRGDYGRTISFKTLDRGQRTVRVQVSACTQWRGFGSRLYLESGGGQEIQRVRLVP